MGRCLRLAPSEALPEDTGLGPKDRKNGCCTALSSQSGKPYEHISIGEGLKVTGKLASQGR